MAAGLVILVLLVFGQTASHGFVDLDDPLYVTQNTQVQGGLTPAGLRWAWTTGHAANWHPVTWMSHQLDVTVFGLDAGAHHVVNVTWHALGTLLLFGLLVDLTGAPWRSAWVAALFAVHPAHVESVAWIAERKDVLSTVFWFATTWAWVRYTRRPRPTAYVAVVVCFVLGLASKPMLVTLPLTLLLLDVWPLRRLARGARALVVEKLPLFALAAASSIITVLVQQHGGAVSGLDQLPIAERLAHAVGAYGGYLRRLVWPVHLGVFYPYSPTINTPAVLGAAVVMVAISAAAWSRRATAPWLGVGWTWFVVTMIPVIGLVQVGTQAMADRYTYVPFVGLFIALAWGAAAIAGRASSVRRLVQVGGVASVAAAAWLAHAQVATWRTSETMWVRAVQVSPDSARAHNSLGAIYGNQGRLSDAAFHFQEALRLRPDGQEAQHILPNLARALMDLGRTADAIPYLQQSLRLWPDRADLHHSLGLALLSVDRTDEAIAAWRQAVRLTPDAEGTWSLLGMTLAGERRAPEARAAFAEVLRINPGNAEAQRAMQMLGGR
jgi:Flp pilus assembly protein TadD